jgi:hypothetical protein
MKIETVNAQPAKIKYGSIFIIDDKNVSYLIHNYFKYPCKFIPQIPSWALENLISNKKAKKVYDPFLGSGTTLVEAALHGHCGYGADIDPLSRMLTKVKTNSYSTQDIAELRKILNRLSDKRALANFKKYIPALPNINLFFDKKTIEELASLRGRIERIKNVAHYEFFLVMFASIIRKASLTDDVSPKPYVSKKHPKRKVDWFALFIKKSSEAILRAEEFSKAKSGKLVRVESDARNSNIKSNSIDIAITSPPYINAFDYVRSLKLENYWLGLVDDASIEVLRKNNIGTESARKDERNLNKPPKSLVTAVALIAKVDMRRSKVVSEYFFDMNLNLQNVHKLLKKGAKYVIVVADSDIRGVAVPTSEILILLAKQIGFKCNLKFGYMIRNRYLRIPRKGRGGLMKIDWVVILEKN